MAGDSQCVLSRTVNAELSSHVLRSDTHGHEAVVSLLALEDLLAEQVRVNLVRHLRIAHRLEATADTDVDLAGANGVRNCGNCLEARGAQAVDSLNGSSFGIASHEHGHARVSGGGAWVEHVSNDDVLNERLVNA